MNPRLLFFLLLFITGGFVCKATNPAFFKFAGYGGPQYLHYTSDGNIIAVGADSNAVIYKFDAAGNIQWSRRFIPFSHYPTGSSVTEDAEGNYVVSGTAYELSPQQNNPFIAKFTPSGTLLYLKKIQFTNFDTRFNSLIPMPDSGFVAVGSGVSSSVLTARFDKTGNIVWAQSYLLDSGPVTQAFSALPADNYNSLIVAGVKFAAGMPTQLFKIDLSTGTLTWGKLFSFPGYAMTFPGKLVSCNNGYAFSGQLADSLNARTAFLIRTDIDGNMLWAKGYVAPQSLFTATLAHLADDGFDIAGSMPLNGGQQFFMRTDPNGNVINEFNTGNPMYMSASDEVIDLINGPGNTLYGSGFNLIAFDATPFGICQAFLDSITTSDPTCLTSNDSGTLYINPVTSTDQSSVWPVADGNIVITTSCNLTGIAETEKESGYIISPNPAGEAFITLSPSHENMPEIDAVDILDYTGRLIMKRIPENNGRLTIPNEPGIYFLNLYSENKLISVQKLIRVN